MKGGTLFDAVDGAATETEVYTDGACLGNPGPGGWAHVRLRAGDEPDTASGAVADTTNNRMELTAVIKALECYGGPLHVVTDSTYVIKGITEWIQRWKANGWRTRARQPVANVELWQELDTLRSGRQVRFSWVKGHARSEGNLLADRQANAAAHRVGRS